MAWRYESSYFFNKVSWNEILFRDKKKAKFSVSDGVAMESVNDDSACSDTDRNMNLHLTLSENEREGRSDTLRIDSGRQDMSSNSTMDLNSDTQTNSGEGNYQQDATTGETIRVKDSHVVPALVEERPNMPPEKNMNYNITDTINSVEATGRHYEQDEASDDGSELTAADDLEDAQLPYTQEEGPMYYLDTTLIPCRQHMNRPRERALSGASELSDIEVISIS